MKHVPLWLLLFTGCTSSDYVNSARTDVDINGDGFADLVATDLVGGQQHLVLYFGGPDFFDGTAPTREAALEPDVTFLMSGSYPLAMGDADGDGFTDIVLPRQRAAENFGLAVFYGGVDGLSATRETVIELPNAPSVSALETFWVGDVRCDGFDDIGVNPVSVDSAGRDGWLVQFDGSEQPVVSRLNQRANGVGDVNGDGCDDIVIGETLFHGSPTGLVETTFTDGPANPVSNRDIDLNGDGFADFRGREGWYLGSAASLPTWSRQTDNVWTNDNSGFPLGDFNSDGFVDYVNWSANGPTFPDAPTSAWTLRTLEGREARELTLQQRDNEHREVLVPTDVYVDFAGDDLPGAVQRYLGSPGDIDGDGYPDLLADGRLTNFGFIARGGPRFRGNADALVETANTGWAGVFDNGR